MFHSPLKPFPLRVFHTLEGRIPFSKEQSLTFNRLSRGHDGESNWAQHLQQHLHNNPASLFDIHLQSGENEFQLDHLLLFQKTLYLFEIKNFEGDYVLNNEQWYLRTTKKEIRNPLHQLSRSHMLLQQFLNRENIQIDIHPYLIFIHPNFHLYQATENIPAVFPGQLQRFLKHLNQLPSSLHSFHHRLIDTLTRHHIHRSIYEQLPHYEYTQLKKGVLCQECRGWMKPYTSRHIICSNCNKNESFKSAIIRSIKEFQLLFPNQKLTANRIFDWCGFLIPKRSVQQTLLENYKLINKGRYSYYVTPRQG